MQRSLDAYLRQSYGRTELVIVMDGGTAEARDAVRHHLSQVGREDIRLIELDGLHALGALRNIGIAHARGDVLCQWDDDDIHHPERVAQQFAAMSAAGAQACYLQDVLHYLAADRILYWTNWAATPAKMHPGTMMCMRGAGIRYPEEGSAARLGEDTVALMDLQMKSPVHALAGAPHLMVYVAHGGNAFPAEHHHMLTRTLGISQALLRRREAQLRDGVRALDFGAAPVTVMGANGVAFVLVSGPDRG